MVTAPRAVSSGDVSAEPGSHQPWPGWCLLDDSAGNSVAAVARWIRTVVVRCRVDDNGAAVGVEHRHRTAGERQAVRRRFQPPGAVRADRDVGEVSRMRPARVQRSVLLLLGVEVFAGAGELGRLAFARLVDVQAVSPRRQPLGLDDDADTPGHLTECCRPNWLLVRIPDVGSRGSSGRSLCCGAAAAEREARDGDERKRLHAGTIPFGQARPHPRGVT
jgi:hypothetical protein